MARPPGIDADPGPARLEVVEPLRCAVGRSARGPRTAIRSRPASGAGLQVERGAGRPGQADELQEHGGAELRDGPARRDELAELVLGEQGVGLALGVLEGASPLALELRDARAQPIGLVACLHGRSGQRLDRVTGGSAAAEGAQQEDARHGARIEVPGRALAQPQGEAAPRHEGAGGARAVTTGPHGRARRPRRAAGPRARPPRRRGRRRKRVEDGLVADRAATPARQPVGGRAQHRGHGRAVERRGVVRPRGRLQEGRAVERPRRAADRGDEPVARRPAAAPRGVSRSGSSASSASTARKPITRLSPWSPSPRTVSRRVR